jgi:hypothetical protein
MSDEQHRDDDTLRPQQEATPPDDQPPGGAAEVTGAAAQLPIPAFPSLNPRVLADRLRLRHRRKRFTL